MADIAYRHPPGIQADNHRIQAIEAPLSFAYQARGERACPVPGDLDLEGSHLRHHGLLRRAVPRVRARLRAGLALLIPQVLGQLRGQAALQGLLEQRGQQSLAARHLDLASIKTLKQRIQRPRATQVLHSLTPTSASHNNIIIIHHASILSNKKTDTQTIEHALCNVGALINQPHPNNGGCANLEGFLYFHPRDGKQIPCSIIVLLGWA